MISVIIPVYKERDTFSFFKSLNSLKGEKEIIVIGSKEDKFTKGLQDFLIKRKIGKFFLTNKGRANQMNFGASKAKGEILLFLHSDTFLPENAFKEINKTIYENNYVGGAFSLKLDSSHIFLKFISKLTTIRSKITKIPYGDQAIFIKKSFFEKINGYRNIPILEDVDLMEKIQKNKGKIKILSYNVISSSRKWKKDGIFFCTFRNRLIILMHILHFPPEKILSFFKY